MSNKVTITPDPPMQKLAQDARDVQDAVSGTAVSGLLNRTMKALGKYPEGTDWVNQHPIVKTIINKLEHLARMEQDSDAMNACFDLAEGNPVTVEIITL